ncbi:hypothetical protein LQZ18_01635 [Lachnospiraceae bacterium ZAX-1]
MGTKNTGIDDFDEQENEEGKLTKNELLLNESDILAGLLALGNAKDNASNYEKIKIVKAGKLLLEFRVRPISEDESQQCYKKATKYAAAKSGQPRKAIETNGALARSYLIYTATIDEDRKKVWGNEQAKQQLNVLNDIDMIDIVLDAGTKDRVIEKIEEISGYNYEAEDLAQD